MNIEDFINQADGVFNNEGAPCDFGCSQRSVPTMIKYIKKHLSPYPYCVVADWKWIDMNASEKTRESLDSYGLKPSALLARRVITDERMRPFESVRTTLLQGFHKNCIFLTRNTAYILSGPGTRVSIDTRVFTSIFG